MEGFRCRLRKGTLGTRGFSSVRREFSVLAEGRHIFGRRPKPRAAKPREKPAFRAGHYKDLTETGNRARKVSGTQGNGRGSLTRVEPQGGLLLAMIDKLKFWKKIYCMQFLRYNTLVPSCHYKKIFVNSEK